MKQSTMLIIGLLVMLLGTTGCAEKYMVDKTTPSAEKTSETNQEYGKPSGQQEFNGIIDGTSESAKVEALPKETSLPQRKEDEPKPTVATCEKNWQPLKDNPNPLLSLESGKITLYFKEGITFAEAKKIVQEYNVEFTQVIEIFPLSKDHSDEERYNVYRRIKARVTKGSEIGTACEILQDPRVEEAAPAITTDAAALAKLAK